MIQKIKKFLREPIYGSRIILRGGNLNEVSDKKYLEIQYKRLMNRKLDISNPITFNEKLQWLKLYDRNEQYIRLVDKLEVRGYIEQKIGGEYLIPLLGVWGSFDEIDFEKLPNQFVLKTTHDSGGVVICRDKNNFNISEARAKLEKSLKNNYFYAGREWPYKNIIPKIIGEELLSDEFGNLPEDYKFHCFHGEPDNVMVCLERDTGNPKFYFFDNKWNLLKYNYDGLSTQENFTLKAPRRINEMFDLAQVLSEDYPFVRVDLYYENEKIYFGELTFYPQSGFDNNLLLETDQLFGEKVDLSKINQEREIT